MDRCATVGCRSPSQSRYSLWFVHRSPGCVEPELGSGTPRPSGVAPTDDASDDATGGAEPDDATDGVLNDAILNEEAVEVVHRVVTDPARLTRTWADARIAVLGEGPYVELVAVAARRCGPRRVPVRGGGPGDVAPTRDEWRRRRWRCAGAGPSRRRWGCRRLDLDDYHEVNGECQPSPFTAATDADHMGPSRHRLLFPRSGVLALEWTRAISRPQVELIAVKISDLNHCFY